MTKAVTCVAAMQLVEQGKLSLEGPLPDIDRALSAPQVLEGFDPSGAPRLRPAVRPVTLHHLLTHTSGFVYEAWDEKIARYVPATGTPPTNTGKLAALRLPLAFDPGDRWEYGIGIDWVGRVVEAVSGQPLDAYVREHVSAPLGMRDSGFQISPEQRARQVRVHARQGDGGLDPQPLEAAIVPEFWAGGGGLYSTAPDYLAFVEMLLGGGARGGVRILRAETVARMGENHIGDLPAGVLRTQNPGRSANVDFFPGAQVRWGLAYMLNMEPGPNGRRAGTVSWAGIYNTYYWIDPAARVTGVIMSQILPFADPRAVAVYGRFERAVYDALAG
jgi:CubicO group peptidase (beta-lactamase class C family)